MEIKKMWRVMIKENNVPAVGRLDRGATTIIIAVLITTVILTIALAAVGIIVSEIKMSQQLADSIPAYYAAEAGAEKCLYQARCAAIDEDQRAEECDQATGGAGDFDQGCAVAGQNINNQEIKINNDGTWDVLPEWITLPITLPGSGAKIEEARRDPSDDRKIKAAGSYNQIKRSVELTW